MKHKIILLGVALVFSSSASALDLQREHLLNLYHGVESNEVAPPSEWVNLSTGIAPNYQSDEQDDVQFAPLPEEPKTEFGVFTHESLEEDIANSRDYEFTTPTQFGHTENESYGVYMKKRF